MERIFKDSRTIQRYTSGPLSFCIQQLVERLCQQGYTREQAHKHLLHRRRLRYGYTDAAPLSAMQPSITHGSISISSTDGRNTAIGPR